MLDAQHQSLYENFLSSNFHSYFSREKKFSYRDNEELVSDIDEIVDRFVRSLNPNQSFTPDDKEFLINEYRFYLFDSFIEVIANSKQIEVLERHRDVINNHMSNSCDTRKDRIRSNFNFMLDIKVMKFILSLDKGTKFLIAALKNIQEHNYIAYMRTTYYNYGIKSMRVTNSENDILIRRSLVELYDYSVSLNKEDKLLEFFSQILIDVLNYDIKCNYPVSYAINCDIENYYPILSKFLSFAYAKPSLLSYDGVDLIRTRGKREELLLKFFTTDNDIKLLVQEVREVAFVDPLSYSTPDRLSNFAESFKLCFVLLRDRLCNYVLQANTTLTFKKKPEDDKLSDQALTISFSDTPILKYLDNGCKRNLVSAILTVGSVNNFQKNEELIKQV